MNNDTWSGTAALPAGNQRQYSSRFSDGAAGFIVDGLGSGYLNDVWIYDTLSNSRSSKTALLANGLYAIRILAGNKFYYSKVAVLH